MFLLAGVGLRVHLSRLDWYVKKFIKPLWLLLWNCQFAKKIKTVLYFGTKGTTL